MASYPQRPPLSPAEAAKIRKDRADDSRRIRVGQMTAALNYDVSTYSSGNRGVDFNGSMWPLIDPATNRPLWEAFRPSLEEIDQVSESFRALGWHVTSKDTYTIIVEDPHPPIIEKP